MSLRESMAITTIRNRFLGCLTESRLQVKCGAWRLPDAAHYRPLDATVPIAEGAEGTLRFGE
jgi:hypothetical protein